MVPMTCAAPSVFPGTVTERDMTNITIRRLGRQDYCRTWQAMQDFTDKRNEQTADELWITEHPPVYTLGLNGRREHILDPGDIPVVATDRGGQATYHGPGQLVLYVLLDLARRKTGIRDLVTLLEQAMISSLAEYGIQATSKAEAPGVYVAERKIGSVGLRIKKGCSYHGLSLNNQMQLQPFSGINPCGYPGLKVTSLAEQGVLVRNPELAVPIVHYLKQRLS